MNSVLRLTNLPVAQKRHVATVALCFVALASSVLQPQRWILTTECQGGSHREPTRLLLCFSTYRLLRGFNPRYNYILLIQVHSQGYQKQPFSPLRVLNLQLVTLSFPP